EAIMIAITAGRLLPAAKDAKRTELLAAANDDALSAALGELAKAEPKLKTKPVTKDLGKGKSQLIEAANDECAARQAKIREAVATEFSAVKKEFPTMGESRAYDMAAESA